MLGFGKVPFFVTAFVGLAMIPACSLINKKVDRVDELLIQGNVALTEKRYDDAIEFYDRGLKIVPEGVMFLTNKSIALRSRGGEVYNSSIKLSDGDAKNNGIALARRDFENAAALSTRALANLRRSRPMEIYDLFSPQDIKLTVTSNHAETLRLVAKHFDKSRAEEAFAATEEYASLEPDLKKKVMARIAGCKLLLESGNGARALDEYRKILDEDPEQLDAILGVGLALSQSGEEEKFREAKYYLKRFVDKAPDEHPMKADVKQTLEYMK